MSSPAAVLTSGCGGGSGAGAAGTTSTPVAVTRPTGEWVAGYCSAALELFVFFVDFRDSTLGDFLSPKDAGRDLSFRTGIFVHEINRLERPDWPKGDEGMDTIRALVSRAIEVASDCVDLAADMRNHYPSSPAH